MAPTAILPPTPRRAARLLLADPATLAEPERGFLAALRDSAPALTQAADLMRRFQAMVKEGAADQLKGWIAEAAVGAFPGFAGSLDQDFDAVRAALSEPWSTGPDSWAIFARRISVPLGWRSSSRSAAANEMEVCSRSKAPSHTVVTNSRSGRVERRRVGQRLLDHLALLRVDAEMDGCIGLRVAIDQQHPLALPAQQPRDIHAGHRLADPALVVGGAQDERSIARAGSGRYADRTGRGLQAAADGFRNALRSGFPARDFGTVIAAEFLATHLMRHRRIAHSGR